VSDRKSRRGKGGKRERIEAWIRQLSGDVRKAVGMVRARTSLDLDGALTCVSIAVLEAINRWGKKSGPPGERETWAPYLAHAAYHVHLRKLTKDAKLLEFRAPVKDEHHPVALDTPAKDPSPEEIVIFKEDFARASKHLLELSRSQINVIVLWMVDYSYAEISLRLGIAESRARTLKQEGILALRSKMLRQSDDSGGRNGLETA